MGMSSWLLLGSAFGGVAFRVLSSISFELLFFVDLVDLLSVGSARSGVAGI